MQDNILSTLTESEMLLANGPRMGSMLFTFKN